MILIICTLHGSMDLFLDEVESRPRNNIFALKVLELLP